MLRRKSIYHLEREYKLLLGQFYGSYLFFLLIEYQKQKEYTYPLDQFRLELPKSFKQEYQINLQS